MSTRTAKDDSEYHQSRYASSSEFERGLLANLVAKRAALVDCREDRELLWAIHFFSHQEGGLNLLVKELIAKHGEQFGTEAMAKIGKHAGQKYGADEVKTVRNDLPYEERGQFPLRGEIPLETLRSLRLIRGVIPAKELRDSADDAMVGLYDSEFDRRELTKRESQARQDAEKHPASYPVENFLKVCQDVARENLEQDLKDFSLDPALDFDTFAPWYFLNLIPVLRKYTAQWIAQNAVIAETKLSRIVAEEFDYTSRGRCLSLLEGEARRGKSFAAKNCCLKNPGRARFVEVPPGADDTSFFRALARGLGLGSFLKYKTIDIRERVESVLLTGDLILVLDEAQRLWPDRNQRYAHPSRINWIMMLANHKVPILLISTPQFIAAQKIAEKTGWNSAQLTGRVANYKFLPADLDDADLMAVCRVVLPEAGEHLLRVLAAYARTSARYLAAIETIAMRARYLAERSGRMQCTADDVRAAMTESVIPSDNRLKSALEKSHGDSSRRRLPAIPMPAMESPDDSFLSPAPQPSLRNPNRRPIAAETKPAPRRASLTEFSTV